MLDTYISSDWDLQPGAARDGEIAQQPRWWKDQAMSGEVEHDEAHIMLTPSSIFALNGFAMTRAG